METTKVWWNRIELSEDEQSAADIANKVYDLVDKYALHTATFSRSRVGKEFVFLDDLEDLFENLKPTNEITMCVIEFTDNVSSEIGIGFAILDDRDQKNKKVGRGVSYRSAVDALSSCPTARKAAGKYITDHRIKLA